MSSPRLTLAHAPSLESKLANFKQGAAARENMPNPLKLVSEQMLKCHMEKAQSERQVDAI